MVQTGTNSWARIAALAPAAKGLMVIAAMALGRSCYGVEISPGYCDVILRRAQAFQASQFRLASDGRTFDEMKAQRS